MQNKFEITFEGDLVKVISEGEKDYRFLERLWTEVVAVCNEYDCHKVLGIARTTKHVEALEGLELAQLFRELNVTRKFRLAWVEHNQEARHIVDFIETVLSNRGLPGRAFDTEEEAREWLARD
ncbi:MAG: hypothetical protein OEM60_13220 [Gammaproteobacteria bacterium]|nr:hypothetical protein [Gammaproteobacteria bacterium]MDH3431940.1 hypothetical protein [Gammaproteobacteria bacterium]MDH3434819.1 hypothetical protein [Gammaproteobacteria bacterium]